MADKLDCPTIWWFLLSILMEVSRTNDILSIKLTAMQFSSPYYPKRLIDSGWTGVPSMLSCAANTRATFPAATGFLYNSLTRLCTPMEKLEYSSAPGARVADVEEGYLYMERFALCPQDFELHQVGVDGAMACLRLMEPGTYIDAVVTCSSLGATMASAKNLEKKNLIVSLMPGIWLWIGLDDLAQEGNYVWQIDGTVMTADERSQFFQDGQPNNLNGQHCIEIEWVSQKFNDYYCDYVQEYFCEIPVNL